MRKVLGPEFFNRSTLVVARELLGKYLVRKMGKKEVALMIVETEAYHGTKDLACHARVGKTARNAPMWGHPAHSYVYFTYGMHWMLNVVTGPVDFPSAVLIRGLRVGNVLPSGEMYTTPTPPGSTFPLLDGPAKLTKYLKIDAKLNGKKLGRGSGLWVEDRGVVTKPGDIKRTPRVGIPGRGVWTAKPWRFILADRAGTGPARRARSGRRWGETRESRP